MNKNNSSATEDGNLKLGDSIENIIFHQTLNIFIVTTKANTIKVFDPHTNLQLASIPIDENSNVNGHQNLHCSYLAKSSSLVVCKGRNVGIRHDHQGVLLLNSILQGKVKSPDAIVKIELLFSEALQLQQALQTYSFDGVVMSKCNPEAIAEVKEAIDKAVNSQPQLSSAHPKAAKWKTICISLPVKTLKTASGDLVKLPLASLAVSLFSSISYQLLNLLEKSNNDCTQVPRSMMFSEAMRLSTFYRWPHMDYKWALPEEMAQAGFFHQPSSDGDDRAMCFICNVCLVYWEPTDEPWSEHERHSPNCPFVKGLYNNNVPLSITRAAAPAMKHTEHGEVNVLSSGNSSTFFVTGMEHGSFAIWNLMHEVKKEVSFNIDPTEPLIFHKHFATSIAYTDMPESYKDGHYSFVVGFDDMTCQIEMMIYKALEKSKIKSDDDVSIIDYEMDRGNEVALNNLLSNDKMHAILQDNAEYIVPLNLMKDLKVTTSCIITEDDPKSAAMTSLIVGLSIRKYSFHGINFKKYEVVNQYNDDLSNMDVDMDHILNELLEEQNTCPDSIPNLAPYLLVYDLNYLISAEKPAQTSKIKGKKQRKASGISAQNVVSSVDTQIIEVFNSNSSKSMVSNSKVKPVLSDDKLSIAPCDVKSSPSLIQCVRLPHQFCKRGVSFEITNTLLTPCANYLLVSVKSETKERDSSMDGLLLYRIISADGNLKLQNIPYDYRVFETSGEMPQRITFIPSLSGNKNDLHNIMAGVICEDGSFVILSLVNLQYIYKHATHDVYNDLVYCHSIERMCVTCSDGKVTLFNITNNNELEDSESTLSSKIVSALCVQDSDACNVDVEVQPNELLVNQEITEDVLDKCLQLTQFDVGAPRFVATIAPCWSEVMQAQKQRRNPLHLQNHSQDMETTRSWKLERDPNTENEHIFDLLFPPCGGSGTGGGLQIGHIDVKFNFDVGKHYLQEELIQVTLLKRNLKNLLNTRTDLDENKTLEDFIEANKADILCGPFTANDYMDLCGQTATITMTSPELMACRSRSYIIYMKSFKNTCIVDKNDPAKLNLVGQYVAPQPTTTKAKGVIPPKFEVRKGCNVIEEISVSVYTCLKTTIQHDRLQRLAMLEKSSYHEALFLTAIQTEKMYYCHRCLDIFFWVLTVHMSSRNNNSKQETILECIRKNLSLFVKSCIIYADRSIAHKAAKILVVILENLKCPHDFAKDLLDSLLECKDELVNCQSAGALFYYFNLLNHVKWCNIEETCAKITNVVTEVSQMVKNINNPLHQILQSKFDLHGSPFEKQLFDSYYPSIGNLLIATNTKTVTNPQSNEGFISTSISEFEVNNNLGGVPSVPFPNYQQIANIKAVQNQEKNPVKNTEEKDKPLSVSHFGMCGLLEVEPLSFVLHNASDVTKLKMVAQGSNYCGNPLPIDSINIEEIPQKSYPSVVDEIYNKIMPHHEKEESSPTKEKHESNSTSGSSEASTPDGDGVPNIKNEKVKKNPKKVIESVDKSAESKMEKLSKKPEIPKKSFPPYVVSIPPQFVISIERMHSGARRFVVLDFIHPVVLTDVIIPACSDVLSLTLDIWLHGEEIDGQRLAIASDINSRPLVLCDLQPPPVCRFIKITPMGRYGMVSSNCRISVGSFYGHSYAYPWLLNSSQPKDILSRNKAILSQIKVLKNMRQDLYYRYGLACTNLKTLLEPFKFHSPEFQEENNDSIDNESEKNIRQYYQDCISEQQHLNLVTSFLERLEQYCNSDGFVGNRPNKKKVQPNVDFLSTLLQYLLNCLLELSIQVPQNVPKNLLNWCTPKKAHELIEVFCIQSPRSLLFRTTASFLSRLCIAQEWWGRFIGDLCVSLFKTGANNSSSVRTFKLLCFLGKRACESGRGTDVINEILTSLLSLTCQSSDLDFSLICWLLLFLSNCLDVTLASKPKSISQNRWTWLNGETHLQTKSSNPSKTSAQNQKAAKELLRKRLSYHRQKLVNLETATKSFGEVLAGLGSWGSNPRVLRESQAAFSRLQRQHALKHFKDLCSIRKHENTTLYKKTPFKKENGGEINSSPNGNFFSPLDRQTTLVSCQRLISLVIDQSPIEVDSFMLICKVIGELTRSSRPSLSLSEIITEEQLESLICQTLFVDVSSGGQWATHALNCMLQDTLEGECLYGAFIPGVDDIEENVEDLDETSYGEVKLHASPSDEENYVGAAFSIEPPVISDQNVFPNDDMLLQDHLYLSEQLIDGQSGEGANHLAVLVNPPLVNVATSYSDAANIYGDSQAYPDSASTEDDCEFVDPWPPSFNLSFIDSEIHSLTDKIGKPMEIQVMNEIEQLKSMKIQQMKNMNKNIKYHHYLKNFKLPAGAFSIKKLTDQSSSSQTMSPFKSPKSGTGSLGKSGLEHSSAIDARLESGISLMTEIRLKMMNAIHTSKINKGLTQPVTVSSKWKESNYHRCHDIGASIQLLANVFQNALSNISIQGDYKLLESLLEMWLNLNLEVVNEESQSNGPLIPLNKNCLSSILSITARHGAISIRGWSLILQTLSLCCTYDNFSVEQGLDQPSTSHQGNKLDSLAWDIVADRLFIPVLTKLFSDNSSGYIGTLETKKDMIGSTVTNILDNLLLRLVLRCNMIPCPYPFCENPKIQLLKLLLRLMEPGAPLYRGVGPLDAQKALLDVLLTFPVEDIQNNYLCINIINSIAIIVHNYLSGIENRVTNGFDQCSSLLFAHVIDADNKQGPPINRQSLMCSLVNLASKLLLIPVREPSTERSLDAVEEISGETDELKALRNPNDSGCHHSNNTTIYICDDIVNNQEVMNLLLISLSKIKSSSFIMALGIVNKDISDKLCLSESFTDALFKFMLDINRKSTSIENLLKPIIRFLTHGGNWSQLQLSECLFYYMCHVIDCPAVLKKFIELGGLKLVFKNLVESAKWLGSGQIGSTGCGVVCSVLSHLNPQLPACTHNNCVKKSDPDENLIWKQKKECENRFKGLCNFAPLATIWSSNRTARPADCLLDNNTLFHRSKVNSTQPPWSYNFYPNETWVDLILTLPCAIMLHEVHLQQHTMILGMSPSSVSIETGIDMGCLTPSSGLICTAGLTSVQVVLSEPVVASVVIIRLIRPVDQTTVGLSQIKLLGTTALKTILRQKQLQESGEIMAHSNCSYWLRIINHCLYVVDNNINCAMDAIAQIPEVMPVLVSLICKCPSLPQDDNSLEKIVLAVASYSFEMRLKLVKGLLSEPIIVLPTDSPNEMAITMLHDVCMKDTSCSSIEILIDCLHDSLNRKLTNDKSEVKAFNPALIQCIATIFWNAKQDPSHLFSLQFFRKCYEYYTKIGKDKDKFYLLLCSMCMVKPELYVNFLVYLVNGTVRNDYDGLMTQCTDDMKECMDGTDASRFHLKDKANIAIDAQLLSTLKLVTQSAEASLILLESGFPILLVNGILEWCKSELLNEMDQDCGLSDQQKSDQEKRTFAPFNASLVASTLETLACLVQQPPIKEWIGSGEGSLLWTPLVNVLGDPMVTLCLNMASNGNDSELMDPATYDRIEDATINLMKECICHHYNNQKFLSSVICQLILRQKLPPDDGMTFLHSLSGFTRRIILQVVLDVEYMVVHITTAQGVLKSPCPLLIPPYPLHPEDGIGHRNQLLYLPSSTTIEQVLAMVTENWQGKASHAELLSTDNSANDSQKLDLSSSSQDIGPKTLELVDKLAMAVGSTKERIKNFKNNKQKKEKEPSPKSENTKNSPKKAGYLGVTNEYLMGGSTTLPTQMSLAQVLTSIHNVVGEGIRTKIKFELVQKSRSYQDDSTDDAINAEIKPPPSSLEVFTANGVLSHLAERMTLLYPENSIQLSDSSGNTKNPVNSFISLGAFTLFLRLPGYSEALLADSADACNLLRIALGANVILKEVSTKGSQEYTLATLPFKILENLFANTPATTDDGRLLRRMCLKIGALHLILACLVVLSRQDHTDTVSQLEHPNIPINVMIRTAKKYYSNPYIAKNVDNDKCHYWAKGTGFGTGSTNQTWNVEHSIQKQQMEEQHIVWLLRLLSHYINPSVYSDKEDENMAEMLQVKDDLEECIPSDVYSLIQKSGLISRVSSYLSNDSVLDMSRHVPLYRALMDLIKSLAINPSLSRLLCSGNSHASLASLLSRMLNTVNTYMNKLDRKLKCQDSSSKTSQIVSSPRNFEDDGEEGLSLLVPHIRTAAALVKASVEKLYPEGSISHLEDQAKSDQTTLLGAYLSALKPQQFASFDLIVEREDGRIEFTVPYHFEQMARKTNSIPYPQKRLKRLAQEVVTLSSSLPFSFSSSVFVRTDNERLDVMKVLITGPEDTPYANGCFEFDVFFPPEYPAAPLLIKLQTTGEKKIRFNPNLYKDGKVCLSILNTWHGRPEEKWNPNTSSLLQVLVSIQSLILVKEPYFNEPGYERSRGTLVGIAKSQEYDSNIINATVQWAILNQLKNPSACFKEVIYKHFWLKKAQVFEQIDTWIREMQTYESFKLSIGKYLRNLKRLRGLLEEEYQKLTPPEGIDVTKFTNQPAAIPEADADDGFEEVDDFYDADSSGKFYKLEKKSSSDSSEYILDISEFTQDDYVDVEDNPKDV